MNVVELTRDLVRIPSVSGDEAACVEHLARVLRPFGPRVSGRNVWAERGTGARTLLLNSHLDTVPAGSDWTIDPHGAELRDGRVHGLGANDAKGCVAAMCVAFASARLPDDARLVLAATCDEETGGAGLEVLRAELPRLDAAVIGEPTALLPCSGQRGMLRVTIRAHGTRAHAARPWQGDNAIARAARDVVALHAIALPTDELLGPGTLQVTMIQGGVRPNVIPAECTLEIDARTVPLLDNAALLERIRVAVESEVARVSDRFAPVRTEPGEAIVRAAVRSSGVDAPVAFGGVSDLLHVRDVPGIVLGPGRSEQSHRADEWVEVEMLERAVDVYRRTIEEYFAS